MAQATNDASALPSIRKRTRSPAYPFINLESAIAKAKQFYDKEQRNPANVNIAATHWNYAEGSSYGLQTVASLIYFGLMQDDGTGDRRTVRLTQAALRILLDARPNSPDRVELIKQAALAPKIHHQLWEKWGLDLPSDASLRHALLFEWETPFNENAVDSFIAEYRSTIAFAGLVEGDKTSDTEDDGSDRGQETLGGSPSSIAPSTSHSPPTGLAKQHEPQRAHIREFVVPLSSGKAVFQWPSLLSNEDVEDLTDSLKILERKFVRSIDRPKEQEKEQA